MKLTYHEGRNFGDALNPLVFHALFPGMFDQDDTEQFIGIGSIIGLKRGSDRTRRRIYFSSGFAAGDPGTYGVLPDLGPNDDVVCVRGPLTAKALGLPEGKAIADGAILVRHLFQLRPTPTTMPFAYMPHVGSFHFYRDWEGLLSEEGIELIDPADDPMEVMQRIQRTGVLLAEAMHGAIIADAIGIPWVPVVGYGTINTFKWQDFASSMGLSYVPHRIPTLFDRAFIDRMVHEKTSGLGLGLLRRPGSAIYAAYQENVVRARMKSALRQLRKAVPQMSDRSILDLRIEALLEKAEYVRRTYAARS